VLTIQTKYKIGLVFLINFFISLFTNPPDILFFWNLGYALFYTLNLSYLCLLVLGITDLETDKREFKHLQLIKIFSIILYLYFVITQVGYNFVNMLLGYSLGSYFFNSAFFYSFPILHWLFLAIDYGLIYLLIFTFLIFGFSNRRYYGNFVLAFAVLYLIFTLNDLNWDLSFPEWPFPYLISPLFTYASIILVTTSVTYFLFFGQKIKSTYFIVSGLMFFGSHFVLWRYDFMDFFNAPMSIGSRIFIIFSLIALIVSGLFMGLGRTFKRGVRIFITHAIEDYNRYRIGDIAQFLERQEGIKEVYYCEDDSTGNIDAWMQKTVPRCQLLVFVSTEKSLDSDDCATELSIAQDTGLTVIPILGVGLSWEDLKKLDVHREVGTEFNPMEFEEFCNSLYLQIQKYIKSLLQISDNNNHNKIRD